MLNRYRRSTALLAGVVIWGAAMAGAPTVDAPGFVNNAAQAGLMEVEAGKLALKSSSSEAVKTFATRMVADHGKANTELAAIAKSKGIPVPAQLDAEHTSMLHALGSKSGKAFDAAYAEHMVHDHMKAVELFQANAVNPDSELSAFAARTLSVLQEHKRLAENLHANLGKDKK